MSINSKARRDARKKNAPRRTDSTADAALQAYAHLRDADRRVVGGAGLRDGEWAVILDGRVVANTDSAAMVIAMLQRIVVVRESAGRALTLNVSTRLRDAAASEAEAVGTTLEAYLIQLEAERVENAEKRGTAVRSDSTH